MADEVKRLVSVRGALRASATRIINNIETELAKAQPDVETLEDSIGLLNPKESELNAYDKQIQQLLDEARVEADANTAIQYNERLTLFRNRASRWLNKNRHATAQATAQGQRGAEGSDTTSETGRMSPTRSTAPPPIRLPRLEIKAFSGDISKWQNFWGRYESAIHLNDNLNTTDKFCYLQGYLEGTAAKAIEGLALSEENYSTAIDILRERFGRRDLIISAHKNNLLKLSPVHSSTDVNGLRQLYDSCEVEVRSLEALKVSQDQYGSFLGHIIGGLLPSDIVLAFSRSRKDQQTEWEVEELMDFIKKEISCLERTQAVKRTNIPEKHVQEKSSKPISSKNSISKPTVPTAASLQAVTGTPRVCPFCDSPAHEANMCTKSITERRGIVLSKKLCFICLRGRHQANACKVKWRKCKNCGRKHHHAVCETSGNTGTKPVLEAENSEAAALSSGCKSPAREIVLLQTAQMYVTGPNGCLHRTRALFDGGSHVTFIKEELSRKLKLEIVGEETIAIHRFDSNEPSRYTRRKVRFFLQNIRDPSKRVAIEALETREVCGAVFSVPGGDVVKEMTKRGLDLADVTESESEEKNRSSVELIIGADYLWQLSSGKTERLGKSLVAMETIFGWTIGGPTGAVASTGVSSSVAVMNIGIGLHEEGLLSTQLRAFWELDSLGIVDDSATKSFELNETLKSFENSISFRDGRYEVALPWKRSQPELGDNFEVANKRTLSLVKKLKSDPTVFQSYHDVIMEQLKAGIVEEVPNDCVDAVDKPIYYIPHRAVIRDESQTTRLRVVYDASSHAHGIASLNDCLDSGPSLLPELYDILIRFREKKIAVTGDIEKAFHQIGISENDRDALRFLWLKSTPTPTLEDTELIIYRMTRVPFGVTASPFLLAATVKHHVKQYEDEKPIASEALQKDLYVDDLITGEDSVQKAYVLARESFSILKEAGMFLRKWRSNSTELKALLGIRDDVKLENPSLPNPPTCKVLGLFWNEDQDSLLFDVDSLLEFLLNRKNSKRWVLKSVARIFDPLGFLAPFTIRAKFIFQELWEKGLPWDSELPEEIVSRYNSWCEELTELYRITVPRFLFFGMTDVLFSGGELHCFVDASEKAYAAVAYLRYTDEDGNLRTSFVTSKSRVAPLKRLTLPRLELMGAVIGSRLVHRLLQVFTIKPATVKMWTDSTITLHWIRGSSSQWKPFVGNRVQEIHSLTEPSTWSHCAGKDNPADLPTRGKTISDLATNTLWWNGPKWLVDKNFVPSKALEEDYDKFTAQEEMKPACKAVVQAVNANDTCPEPLLDLSRFSSLTKVYRITAWIHRFINNVRPGRKQTGPLAAEELSRAEGFWIKCAQREAFPAELRSLQNGQAVSKESKLSSLQPLLDKTGLMCVGGRLDGEAFTFRERHPWILSSQHRLSALIASHHHVRLMHAGVNDTLVELREYFWIQKARQLIKKIVYQCARCKVFRAKPCTAVMAPLPISRTTPAPPFEVTGIDFAGPLHIRENNKCYVTLFTCAVTRAVHLEVVSDLSTDKFLLAYRRFIARRAIVSIIYSDNAKTFKKAEADLAQLWANMRSPEVADFFSAQKISWRYIADRAPWWGGFWERLVRSVKVALRKVLGQTRLNFEEVGTVLAEVEATINSRPITYIYHDAAKPTPLTPAHFLVGRRLTVLPSQVFSDGNSFSVNRENLTKRLQYRQTLMERFSSRWKKDYLLELRSAHHLTTCEPSKELKVGDVVLIEEAKIPRLMWKLGIVDAAAKGRDGVVRSCSLRLPNGTKLRRPIQLLYNLEC